MWVCDLAVPILGLMLCLYRLVWVEGGLARNILGALIRLVVTVKKVGVYILGGNPNIVTFFAIYNRT